MTFQNNTKHTETDNVLQMHDELFFNAVCGCIPSTLLEKKGKWTNIQIENEWEFINFAETFNTYLVRFGSRILFSSLWWVRKCEKLFHIQKFFWTNHSMYKLKFYFIPNLTANWCNLLFAIVSILFLFRQTNYWFNFSCVDKHTFSLRIKKKVKFLFISCNKKHIFFSIFD